MRSQRTYDLHPHGDHFIDIFFETLSPVLMILKQSNDFISTQTRMFINIFVQSGFLLVKMTICQHVFQFMFLVLDSMSFFSIFTQSFEISIKRCFVRGRFTFSKLCRMENKGFVNNRAKCIQQSSKPVQLSTKMHQTRNFLSFECSPQ